MAGPCSSARRRCCTGVPLGDQRSFIGPALVLHWSCIGPALVLHWSCSGPAAVLQRSCSGAAALLQRSCSGPGAKRVLLQSTLRLIQIDSSIRAAYEMLSKFHPQLTSEPAWPPLWDGFRT